MNSPEIVSPNSETIEGDATIVPDNGGSAAPLDPPADPPADDAPEYDHEAPWGRKADGTPRRKPGRRGAGETGPDPATVDRLNSVGSPPPRRPPPPRTENQPHTPPPIVVDYDNLGKIAATVFFNGGVAIFGKDWEPSFENKEPEQIASAFSKYFESVQMVDISPGWALAITLGMYGVRRMDKPTIRDRLKGAIIWAKSRMPWGR
jgi:hypothetical protein